MYVFLSVCKEGIEEMWFLPAIFKDWIGNGHLLTPLVRKSVRTMEFLWVNIIYTCPFTDWKLKFLEKILPNNTNLLSNTWSPLTVWPSVSAFKILFLLGSVVCTTFLAIILVLYQLALQLKEIVLLVNILPLLKKCNKACVCWYNCFWSNLKTFHFGQ